VEDLAYIGLTILVFAVLLTIYLFVALVLPERF